jgi:hypothetical protein
MARQYVPIGDTGAGPTSPEKFPDDYSPEDANDDAMGPEVRKKQKKKNTKVARKKSAVPTTLRG